MAKKDLKWAFVFLLLISASLTVILLHKPDEAKTAKIIQDGKIIRTVKLQNTDEAYEFEIISEDGGKNTVCVKNGKIGITQASCPDKVCVNRGFTNSGIPPIICLPNKLSIVIDDTDDIDALTGGAAQCIQKN